MTQLERKCPFCEEKVLGHARVCHFCGRDLPAFDRGEESRARGVWRTSRALLVAVVIVLALVALLLAIRGGSSAPMTRPVDAVVASLVVGC